MFTNKEIKYLNSQKLAKLDLVEKKHRSDASAVNYKLDGEKLVIPSIDARKTLKYKIINKVNEKVTIAVDDVESAYPFKKRGIKVDGTAKIVEREGEFGPGLYIEITPKKRASWGINK